MIQKLFSLLGMGSPPPDRFTHFVQSQTPDQLRDENLRWPPWGRGLPVCLPEYILGEQQDIIKQIRELLPFKPQHDILLDEVLSRYAELVQLLPASEDTHHQGAMGLFRHSLEVGLFSLRAGGGHELSADATPDQRESVTNRRLLALFYAGLLHDVGKVFTDIRVYAHPDVTERISRPDNHPSFDQSEDVDWLPSAASLFDWAKSQGVTHYFCSWRIGRYGRHDIHAGRGIERIITPDIERILTHEIHFSLLSQLIGKPNSLTMKEIVEHADAESTRIDLESNHYKNERSLMSFGVPIDRVVQEALQALARRYPANSKDSPMFWVLQAGVFINWGMASQELGKYLEKRHANNVPRNKDSIADILIDRQVALGWASDKKQEFARYHVIYPASLGGKIPIESLRIKHAEYIYPPNNNDASDENSNLPETTVASLTPPPAEGDTFEEVTNDSATGDNANSDTTHTDRPASESMPEPSTSHSAITTQDQAEPTTSSDSPSEVGWGALIDQDDASAESNQDQPSPPLANQDEVQQAVQTPVAEAFDDLTLPGEVNVFDEAFADAPSFGTTEKLNIQMAIPKTLSKSKPKTKTKTKSAKASPSVQPKSSKPHPSPSTLKDDAILEQKASPTMVKYLEILDYFQLGNDSIYQSPNDAKQYVLLLDTFQCLGLDPHKLVPKLVRESFVRHDNPKPNQPISLREVVTKVKNVDVVKLNAKILKRHLDVSMVPRMPGARVVDTDLTDQLVNSTLRLYRQLRKADPEIKPGHPFIFDPDAFSSLLQRAATYNSIKPGQLKKYLIHRSFINGEGEAINVSDDEITQELAHEG
ncbi:MobH family relaxase [uncultured Umboniibacter sp.]|uniref:MobH family relaxase n=1 Tax=uncultured Umboniibacter sp. TaxID=1798917 RepID=UPI002626B9FE|nr:MobH family relaxase [uncultured Umboniibacter sp.]